MKKIVIFGIAFIFSLSFAISEETPYTNYSFARLSYVTGNTYLQRATDLGYEEGVANMPISEGDRLSTTDGRAEIYLGKRNYLRLDNNTKIDFMNLPKRGYDLTRIRVWSGNAYLSVNFLEKEKNIEIHTSDASIYVLERGLYRIDVRENGETEIFVFEGLVETAGEEGSVLIKNEQRLEVVNGRFTSRPTPFRAVAEDSFDRWSEYRDSQVSKRVARQYLPEELGDFEDELTAYGDWVFLRPYGYVWVPRGLDSDWRPYYYGQWDWLPLCGWTWLPYEPWGWAPFHYGRWHWHLGLGWYWIPTPFWGPGWVSWYWGYDYFGWVPLSYYGYPIVVINDVFYPHYYGQYYPYNSRALTVIHKNQLKAKNVSNVALSQEEVKKLKNISLSNKTPSLKPVSNEVMVEKLGDKKIILNKGQISPETIEKRLTNRLTKEPVDIDSKKLGEKAQDSKMPSRKVIEGSAEEKTKVEKKTSEVKKVIKKEEKSPSASTYESRQYIKGGSYGYPASPKISIKTIPQSSRTSKSNSFISRIYKYISGSLGSNSIGRSGSRSSSRGSSSKAVSSRSGSRGSSSASRSGSSSSRSSSGSKSGSVSKKK